jgi:hypothetical protein
MRTRTHTHTLSHTHMHTHTQFLCVLVVVCAGAPTHLQPHGTSDGVGWTCGKTGASHPTTPAVLAVPRSGHLPCTAQEALFACGFSPSGNLFATAGFDREICTARNIGLARVPRQTDAPACPARRRLEHLWSMRQHHAAPGPCRRHLGPGLGPHRSQALLLWYRQDGGNLGRRCRFPPLSPRPVLPHLLVATDCRLPSRTA